MLFVIFLLTSQLLGDPIKHVLSMTDIGEVADALAQIGNKTHPKESKVKGESNI